MGEWENIVTVPNPSPTVILVPSLTVILAPSPRHSCESGNPGNMNAAFITLNAPTKQGIIALDPRAKPKGDSREESRTLAQPQSSCLRKRASRNTDSAFHPCACEDPGKLIPLSEALTLYYIKMIALFLINVAYKNIQKYHKLKILFKQGRMCAYAIQIQHLSFYLINQ